MKRSRRVPAAISAGGWIPHLSARPKPRAPLSGSRLLRLSRRKWLCHYFVGASWGGGPLGCPRHLGTRFCGTEKSHPASGTASGSALTEESLCALRAWWSGSSAPPDPSRAQGHPPPRTPSLCKSTPQRSPGLGGLSTALTYLGVPPALPALRTPLWHPSPASRGPRSPGRVPLTPAAEKPAGRRASAPLRPGSERRREVTAPPSDRERGRRRGSGALTPPPAPIYPRQPKISRAPAANPRNAPSGAKRHFPACCSLEGTRPPALLPAPDPGWCGLGSAGAAVHRPPAPPGCLRKPLPTPRWGLGWNSAFRGRNEIITDLADVHAQPQSPKRVVSSTSAIA